MATTGFWPVYNHLKETIAYAENPDKTVDRKFLDDDLWQALRYVENSDKTDRTMYVSAINCPKQKAYEYMMRTKRRFHETGKIVGYHGFQSFAAGEVAPEEAHRIIGRFYCDAAAARVCEDTADESRVMQKQFEKLTCYDCGNCPAAGKDCDYINVRRVIIKTLKAMRPENVSQEKLLERLAPVFGQG